MSNGIRKVNDIYLHEAEERSDSLVQRIYPVFKQIFTGTPEKSSVGIELYTNILRDEIKHIIALQLNLKDFQENTIDEKNDTPKNFLAKYDQVLRESEQFEEDEEDGACTKYALLAGYGFACLRCMEELQQEKYSALLDKISHNFSSIKIALPTGIASLIDKDKKYIPIIIEYLKTHKIIQTPGEIDVAILYAKQNISLLRYNLQREELIKLNGSNKRLNKLRKLKIQLNSITLNDLEVEETNTGMKIGKDINKELDVEKVNWNEVIGQQEAKKRLSEQAVRYLTTFDNNTKKSIFDSVLGTKAPKAILLFGPAGTGKTMSLKATITEAEQIRKELFGKTNQYPSKKNIHWSIITPDIIKNKYIGESSKAIKRIFDTAKKEAPSLIVIDEIDALSTRRGEQGFNEGEREIMAVLMQELEGIKKSEGYILVGITNAPKCLDKALLSRFDTKVKYDIPKDYKEVASLFKVHLKNLVKIGALVLDQKGYNDLGRLGYKLRINGRLVKQFSRMIERERNEILTCLYKDNQSLIKAYYNNPADMKDLLNKKCKKFDISYLKERMTKFILDNNEAQDYII